jgi:hypothetical protein
LAYRIKENGSKPAKLNRDTLPSSADAFTSRSYPRYESESACRIEFSTKHPAVHVACIKTLIITGSRRMKEKKLKTSLK